MMDMHRISCYKLQVIYKSPWKDNLLPDTLFMAQSGRTFGKCKVDKITYQPKLKWKSVDIIGVQLDLKKRELGYFINDEWILVTHNELPVGEHIKYRLAVYMEHNGQQITIQSFECV